MADSGATQHMFKDSKLFKNYREVQGYSIKVADGKTVPVKGIGVESGRPMCLHMSTQDVRPDVCELVLVNLFR